MPRYPIFLRLFLVLFLLNIILTSCSKDNTELHKESIESSIIGQLMGGFMYTFPSEFTHNNEADYIELRKKSIKELKDSLHAAASASARLHEGLEIYEKKLFEYMDLVEDQSNEMTDMAERILRHQNQYLTYQALLDLQLSKDPDDKLQEAIIDHEQSRTICQIVGLQQERFADLLNITSLVYGFLNDSEDKERFSKECTSVFTGDINNVLDDLITDYYRAAEIYAYIMSSDYYMSEYYLNRMSKDMEKLEALDLLDAYRAVSSADRTPSIIIEPKQTSGLKKGTLEGFAILGKTVYADAAYDDYLTNVIALMLLQELEIKILDKDPDRSFEEIFIEDILLNTKLIKDIQESYRHQEEADQTDIRRRVLGLEELPAVEETQPLVEYAQSMNSALAEGARIEAINRIKTGQDALNALTFAGTDVQYSIMITMIQALINEKLDKDKVKEISELLNNDLEEILGDRKEEFVQRVLNENAEDLIAGFDEWKKNTVNFNQVAFTKDDLTRLIQELGIAFEEVNEEPSNPVTVVIEDDTEEDNAQLAEIGYWELVETIRVIPETYKTGDDKDNREYTFEYTEGMILCNYTRTVYDGIKKTYLNEEIITQGGWKQLVEDGAYLPDENVRLELTASVNGFQRLTPVDSGGNGTNVTGVSVWSYLGNENTPFGNASTNILESIDGKSVCRAGINDGIISLASSKLEVSGKLGTGQEGEQRILFVVVSNQGRIGGIKYIFKYVYF